MQGPVEEFLAAPLEVQLLVIALAPLMLTLSLLAMAALGLLLLGSQGWEKVRR